MSLIDEGKSLLNLVNKAANRDLYDAMLGYLDKVFALTTERSQLQEELHATEGLVKELENALAFKKRLSYGQNAYWTEELDFPYCSGCWDGKKQAIRLVVDFQLLHSCPVCKVKGGRVDHPPKPRAKNA